MAIKMSVAVRNARLDAIEAAIGVTATRLKIRTGAPPTNITDADSGTVLADLTLPADWMNAASAGSKTKLGTWQDATADAAGAAGHFRIYAADGTTQHMQGTISGTGGGGDMELDNVNIAVGQQVTITTFTLTDGNA
jgi:hypothetical protein